MAHSPLPWNFCLIQEHFSRFAIYFPLQGLTSLIFSLTQYPQKLCSGTYQPVLHRLPTVLASALPFIKSTHLLVLPALGSGRTMHVKCLAPLKCKMHGIFPVNVSSSATQLSDMSKVINLYCFPVGKN